MYYVPDVTKECRFYECDVCGVRFLSIKMVPQIVCPCCGENPNMEVGPDEETPIIKESTRMLQVLEGEDVEKYDALLSLAVTGGDYNWI